MCMRMFVCVCVFEDRDTQPRRKSDPTNPASKSQIQTSTNKVRKSRNRERLKNVYDYVYLKITIIP